MGNEWKQRCQRIESVSGVKNQQTLSIPHRLVIKLCNWVAPGSTSPEHVSQTMARCPEPRVNAVHQWGTPREIFFLPLVLEGMLLCIPKGGGQTWEAWIFSQNNPSYQKQLKQIHNICFHSLKYPQFVPWPSVFKQMPNKEIQLFSQSNKELVHAETQCWVYGILHYGPHWKLYVSL